VLIVPVNNSQAVSDRGSSMTLGVGLIPSMRDMQRIIDCQAVVAQRESLSFKLNGTNCIPHLSLVHIRDVDFRKFQGLQILQCSDFVSSVPIECEITGTSYIPRGWIFCDVARSENLMELHHNTFEFAKPYLTPGLARDKDISHYTDHQKIMYRSYGYRFIGDSFSPHVTLGRAAHEKMQSIDAVRCSASAITGTVSFDRLVLFDVGPNGTCREILWQFGSA
jgi:hypothetical protein